MNQEKIYPKGLFFRVKDIITREAAMEIFEEENGVLHKLIMEVIEDIGLMKAIREGETTENVDGEEIFKIPEGK